MTWLIDCIYLCIKGEGDPAGVEKTTEVQKTPPATGKTHTVITQIMTYIIL